MKASKLFVQKFYPATGNTDVIVSPLKTVEEKPKKPCNHKGGKGYWSNKGGYVCLNCGKELSTPTV